MPGPRAMLDRLRRSPRVLGALAVAAVLVAAALVDVPGRLATLAPTGPPTSAPAPTPTATVPAARLTSLTRPENRQLDRCPPGSARLARCGPAPALSRGTWLNTPSGAGVTLDDLRGSVVLVDVFSASCLGCRRAARYVTAWQQRYAGAGLRVVGVHSPEHDFDQDDAWLRRALDELAITFPVLQDQGYATLTTYRAPVVPSTYLVDDGGTVRAISLGEGRAVRTERLIRQLLRQRDADIRLPSAVGQLDDGEDAAPGTTPQIDLTDSPGRRVDDESDTVVGDDTRFRLPPAQPEGTFSLGGLWTTGTDRLTPRAGAVARVSYRGRSAYQLVSGAGTLTVTTSSGLTRRIIVDGEARLHQIHVADGAGPETLTVRYDGDLQVYAFAFG